MFGSCVHLSPAGRTGNTPWNTPWRQALTDVGRMASMYGDLFYPIEDVGVTTGICIKRSATLTHPLTPLPCPTSLPRHFRGFALFHDGTFSPSDTFDL